jgi:acyl-CoA thioester hydrolase
MNNWLETYRGTVYRWELDHNDHFTVAFYFSRIADAGAALLDAIGLGARHTAPDGRDCVTADCYVRYLAELRAGDILHVMSGVIDVQPDGLVLGHKLFDSDGGRLCATVEHRVILVDVEAGRDGRQSIALASGQRAAAHARRIDWDGAPRERRPEPRGLDGFRDSARDTIRPWEVEASGEASLSAYIHRFSAANGHATAAFGLGPSYMRDQRRGFSTFEFQLAVLSGMRSGDLVHVKSALLHVGTSSMRLFHKMFDARTGELRATLEQLGVHLDMDARRSTPLPDTIREKARALLAPTTG